MLESFFIYGEPPSDRLLGTYNFWLVALSFVIASLASYVALDMPLQSVSGVGLGAAKIAP